MDASIVDAVAFVALLAALVAVVKIISEGLLKRKVLAAGLSAEGIREFREWSRGAEQEDALKWGVVWMAIGMALVVVDLLPFGLTDPGTYGLIFLFGGTGLLIYRILAARTYARRPLSIEDEV